MKAIEALNQVWDTLHALESRHSMSSVALEEIRKSKRTIERLLMLLDHKDRTINRKTEL